jgi:hypothetical protein
MMMEVLKIERIRAVKVVRRLRLKSQRKVTETVKSSGELEVLFSENHLNSLQD